MKSIIHRSSRAIGAAMALGLASAGAAITSLGVMPGMGKGPTPNKYNVFKGVSAEILRHNAAIDAAKSASTASKGQRKKQAARQRKTLNQFANGRAV